MFFNVWKTHFNSQRNTTIDNNKGQVRIELTQPLLNWLC